MAEERKSGGLLGTVFALLAKGAKLLKFLKVAKPAVLFMSMTLSIIGYAFLMGPWLAILFVALLLIHEMGHVVAMRMRGFETPAMVFIPFLGAAIFAPKNMDRETEAFVGYGGPLLGTIGTLVVFGAWFVVPHDTPLAHILIVGSYLGAYLNLFNMLPISPLDGGRVTQAAGRWFKYVGLFGLALLSAFYRQPVILYIWILVLFDFGMIPLRLRAVLVTGCWIAMAGLMSFGYGDQPVWVNVVDCVVTGVFVVGTIYAAVTKQDTATPDTRPDLTSTQRWRWFGLYLGLACALAVMLVVQAQNLPHVPHS